MKKHTILFPPTTLELTHLAYIIYAYYRIGGAILG
jgi:hypothetical protein